MQSLLKEVDKLNGKYITTQDEIDTKKRETIIYTQDITKSLRETLTK